MEEQGRRHTNSARSILYRAQAGALILAVAALLGSVLFSATASATAGTGASAPGPSAIGKALSWWEWAAMEFVPPSPESATLTADRFDTYSWSTSWSTAGRSLTVQANPANRGSNLRSVWWSPTEQMSRDQQSCVTWRRNTGVEVQPGVALRIRRRDGEIRAITVSNNVWAGNRSGWNVHTWTAQSGQPTEFQLVGQVRSLSGLSDDPLHLPPLPWRICGRVVGPTVELKAWASRARQRAPRWGDKRFGAAFALPPGWNLPGVPGGYTGHLEPGSQIEFSGEAAGAAGAMSGARGIGQRVRATSAILSF